MPPSLLYKTQTRWLFHSHIKLKLSAFWDESVFDQFYNILQEADRKYNSYTEGSYIHQINNNAGSAVEVDATIVELLSRLRTLSDDLDNTFDITIMPLIRLWGFYKKNGWKVPSAQEITAAKQQVDYRKIQIVGNRIAIQEGQEIVTGSFIKSFAVDAAVEFLRKTGISDAVVNAGGSTIYAINDESHPHWQVQVNDTETDRQLFGLRIANQCYSTSSNENTYLEIDGKRYGHIIHPETGYPSENRQVGIISGNALTGDVLSTGLFNFDKNSFRTKIDYLSSKYGIEGFLVDRDGDIVFSENFRRYINR